MTDTPAGGNQEGNWKSLKFVDFEERATDIACGREDTGFDNYVDRIRRALFEAYIAGAESQSIAGNGNQLPSGLREDPVGDGGEGVPHATTSSSDSFSLAARALVEQWREYVQHKKDCWLNYETRNLVPSESGFGMGLRMRFRRDGDPEPTCTCGLSALLVQAGARHDEKKDEKDLARMDTMGSSTDSRTAPTNEPVRPFQSCHCPSKPGEDCPLTADECAARAGDVAKA